MSFWINGSYNKKTKTKPLKKLGYQWRPYLRFMEKNYVVILKPFCRHPQYHNVAYNTNCKLPNTITDDLLYIQISYMADLLRNQLLVVKTNKA